MFKQFQMLKLYIFLSLICWARSESGQGREIDSNINIQYNMSTPLSDRMKYGKNPCLRFTTLNVNTAFLDIFKPKVKVFLILYTRETITCAQHLFTNDFLLNSEFKPTKKTVWLIHGYRPFGTKPVWLQKLVEVLLSLEDINVIVVDWNYGATTLLYPRAIKRCWTVAEILKEYIKRMKRSGISLQSFHFIGVSLGAHISGYVGNYFGGLLGRISGLDPAGPGFNHVPVKMRLDYTDAQFVDVIHSDADGLGITHSIGHIDFYPNGGRNQPGCPKSILSGVSYLKCDHQRAIFLFLSSLSTKCNQTAYPCNSYEEYRNGKCIDCEAFGLSFCPRSGYYADLWKNYVIKRKPPGLNAFFDTSPKEPFCFYNYVLDIGTMDKIKRNGNIKIKLKDTLGIVETSKIQNGDIMTFSAYSELHILAGFYYDFKEISQIILKFIPKSPFFQCYKCQYQFHHIRLRSLTFPERPDLCKEEIFLKENMDIPFNPHVCD